MISAAVLIVSYFSHERVASLVKDLANQAFAETLIVSVVDNSCDSTEFQKLSDALAGAVASFSHLALTKSEINRGYAGGNNLAFSIVASEEFGAVFVINPDIRITAGTLVESADVIRRSTRSIFVPQTALGSDSLDGRGALDKWTGRSRQLRHGDSPSSRWLVYAGGHFFGISRSTWESVDGLNEEFFLYSEEADLMLRLDYGRGDIVPLPGVKVAHDVGGTTGSQSGVKSPTTLFHASRSSVVLFRRHNRLTHFLPLVIASRLFYALTSSLRGHDGPEVLRGVASGLRSSPGPSYRQTGEPHGG